RAPAERGVYPVPYSVEVHRRAKEDIGDDGERRAGRTDGCEVGSSTTGRGCRSELDDQAVACVAMVVANGVVAQLHLRGRESENVVSDIDDDGLSCYPKRWG